jgi:hypothetical protein
MFALLRERRKPESPWRLILERAMTVAYMEQQVQQEFDSIRNACTQKIEVAIKPLAVEGSHS